ncbi:pentapeptide repeat-containing protein [Pseudaestuariivita atlantica]|uniref:pentapeptide repeat-containing protein n=1 Tax=Pseudaestuariivita atlantica TaxID=1317121 RepID=UPI00067A751A|nr:pentapeptide repeat-containing protein [Pseudaestuariivita atlantica]
MRDTTTITLPIPPEYALGLAVLLGFVGLCLAVSFLLPLPGRQDSPPFEAMRTRLGMKILDPGLFLFLATLWLAIFLVLLSGLLFVLWGVVTGGVPTTDEAVSAFRFALAQIAALTAILGAVITLPITLIRLKITRDQKDIGDEALFNDKINQASTQLAALRQVTQVTGRGKMRQVDHVWEDDIVVRASAIDRLEGLANERPDEIPRIARMLSVYVRELSRASEPKTPPELDVDDAGVPTWESRLALRSWAQSLTPFRPDVEKAVQSLGRLQMIEGADLSKIDIDLRDTNLQGFDLRGLTFESGKVQLGGAQLQGANLSEARLRGAGLGEARLQGAKLVGARLQGANLNGARLQGANLVGARLDEKSDLTQAILRGACVWSADDTTIAQLAPFLDDLFVAWDVLADAETPPPNRATEAQTRDPQKFYEAWRAWQLSIGQDPENPA